MLVPGGDTVIFAARHSTVIDLQIEMFAEEIDGVGKGDSGTFLGRFFGWHFLVAVDMPTAYTKTLHKAKLISS